MPSLSSGIRYFKALRFQSITSYQIWRRGMVSIPVPFMWSGRSVSAQASWVHPCAKERGQLPNFTRVRLFCVKRSVPLMAAQIPSDPFAAHKFNPLDIPTHLLERFEESPLLNFPPAAPPDTGIYGLYINQNLIYIGKAARGSNLKRRFAEHAKKIGGRKNIKLSQMQCRFLMIAEEWVHYAEHHLIGH